MAKEGGKTAKIFILFALVGAIVGAGIVIAVKLPKNLAVKKEIEAKLEDQQRKNMELQFTDLKVPAEFAEIWKDKWYPYRPRMKQWTKEQASSFDLDADSLGNAILQAENDELIKELFKDVP
jgi:hypothetical protein